MKHVPAMVAVMAAIFATLLVAPGTARADDQVEMGCTTPPGVDCGVRFRVTQGDWSALFAYRTWYGGRRSIPFDGLCNQPVCFVDLRGGPGVQGLAEGWAVDGYDAEIISTYPWDG